MRPKKILIAIFSQTGTTLRVAEEISDGLRAASGCEIIFHTIHSLPVPSPAEFDVIGIGTPVYMFRPPFPVKDFINSLTDLKGKSFFTFVQYGSAPGACGNWIRKQMQKKHARDIGYLLTRGSDYFIGYIKRGYLFSADSPNQHELNKAHNFGQLLIRRLGSKIEETEKFDPATHPVYAIERFTTNRLYTKLLYSRFFKADERCDACGICIKKCPVKNIKPGMKKHPVWNSNCILCGTCEMVCPKDAVSSPFDWLIFAPFMAFNINKAKREKTPYVRVAHGDGKTVRIE